MSGAHSVISSWTPSPLNVGAGEVSIKPGQLHCALCVLLFGAATEYPRRSVSWILRQRRIGTDLRLWNRPPLLELGDRLGSRSVRVVCLETVLPVARLKRVATHEIPPALRLEGELPRALHVD